MHDARKLVENFYKPTKPYGGADYERFNLGFRALKQGVPYEVVDKLLSMPLEYDRLLLMLGAFADGRTAEEIKYYILKVVTNQTNYG